MGSSLVERLNLLHVDDCNFHTSSELNQSRGKSRGLSDASTRDETGGRNSNSDIFSEQEIYYSMEVKYNSNSEFDLTTPILPEKSLHLFSQIDISKEIKIRENNLKVKKLMNYLDQSTEPISIRDECSVKAKYVLLGSPPLGILKRKRAMKQPETLKLFH